MKNLVFLFVFIVLGTFSAIGQQLDHALGEILIQCTPNNRIDQIAPKLKTFKGKATQLHIGKLVSKEMNIWKIHFSFSEIHELNFLNYIKDLPLVQNAQFNHFLEKRQTIPNDPQFISQWQWLNLGSSGQTLDADIDAELAWDITTGGTTPQGDDIVVAVLDDGIELSHPDLQDNLWVNTNEIPGNGIDDDNNDYIDDYNGWHIHTQDDNVSGGDHGVEVAGMIGAKGNNMIGLTGINWDVKIMTIKLNTGSLSEADILEAYNYPLRMRQLYDQTNGARGAFVVASNASWGLTGGDPADAPLWCEMYNTLGLAGILNCGATTNSNSNVDINGDLPTNCSSDYLIGIASTDANDVLQGGFGPINVDIAAPGEGVWTTGPNGGYRVVNGTSFASPTIAGMIALMYSAPCSNLTQLAKEAPADAALLIKSYILESADQVDPLANLVLTGARANAFQALEMVLADCGSCPTPLALNTENVIDVSADLTWFSADVATQSNLEWRKVGATNWNNINGATSPYQLTGLEACTDYEWRVQAVCPGETSDFSAINAFKTDGCCVSPDILSASSITNNSAIASWTSVFAAQSYNLRFREAGGSWSLFNTTELSYDLTNLQPCRMYEIQVQTVCAAETTPFTAIIPFQTLGCGACIDQNYCDARGNDSSSEWIDRVILQNLDAQTGNNNGYAFTPNTNVELEAGASYQITLVPQYTGSAFNENFQVWIDFNQDGDFEDAEELVFSASNVVAAIDGLITVPVGALDGSTRMRVAMQFNNQPSSCGEIDFGEVEDYCITILGSTGCFAPTLSIQAINPIPDIQVEILNAPAGVSFYNIRYRKQGGVNWRFENNISGDTDVFFPNRNSIDICSDYEFQIQSECGGALSSWSNSFNFSTLGCGACLDLSYCESRGNSASFEHLERVQINTLDNQSGNNGGYGNFSGTEFTTTLETGSSYDMILTPFFPFDPFDVVYTIWIDYNQDGDFEDAEEKVFESAPIPNAITENITILNAAPSGLTRMRIAMRERDPADNCSIYPFGETEDYCVFILNDADCLYPELSASNITISSVDLSWPANSNAGTYDIQYRITGSTSWTTSTSNQNSYTIDNLNSCEEYEARIRSICNGLESAYSPSILFEMDCITNVSSANIGLNQINITPNPFTEQLNINLDSNKAKDLQVRLYSLSGQILYDKAFEISLGKQSIQIQTTSDWPSGVYYLQVLTDKGSDSYKVVKI